MSSLVMITYELIVQNEEGLHARPAAKFVKLSNQYASEIWVEKGDEKVNGKSIMGLMILAAGKGDKITVYVKGEDEEVLGDKIKKFVLSGFEM